MLHRKIENLIENQNFVRKTKKRRIPYLERGLGSGILQALAEKYHGNYNGYYDDNAYHTVLVLKEGAPDIPQ